MSESLTGPRESAVGAAIAMVACTIACACAWGFTVDDALISVRYTENLAAGIGWRFDAGGAPTDGVTPLPWPVLLFPFAHGDALDILDRVRVFGALAQLASLAWLGARMMKTDAPRLMRVLAIVSLSACVPLATWSSSGMETSFVTALATCAVLARGNRSALLAGACAAFRPEMTPWAIALTAARSATGSGSAPASATASASGSASASAPASAPATASATASAPASLTASISRSIAITLAPFALVTLARLVFFGHAAPLAIHAKPSDFEHGLVYACAGLVASALPVLMIVRPRKEGIPIAIAAIVHVLAVIAAGGDWMPYARLFVPILPSLAYGALLSSKSPRWFVVRWIACVALGVWMWIVAAPLGRTVARDRRELVLRARPMLAKQKVACIDIGWPSAATEHVVDLAGLTDPEIAALPGGHTSKRIDAAMLLDRNVDVVLLYVDHTPKDIDAWTEERFTRVTEARLAQSDLFRARFGAPVFLPAGHGTGYIVLSRAD